MKKKILSLIIATMLVASMLTACGNKNTDTTDSASKETTVVGSDDDGESAPEHVTGDAPASGDASESTNTPTTFEEKVKAASKHAIETFGADGIPELDMEFTTEALNSYIEGEPSNRQVIANGFLGASTNNTMFVYNPSNYGSTLEMIEEAQANYTFGDNIFPYLQDNRDEQIANAIDALTENLGTHIVAMVIDAGDSYPVMFYCANGIGYGTNDVNDERVELNTGGYDSEGYDASNPHCYLVYPDGTVETQF